MAQSMDYPVQSSGIPMEYEILDHTAHADAKAILHPAHDDYDFPLNSMTRGNQFLGYTTDEVSQAVIQLRATLKADGYTLRLDTLTLLRFLRARKMSVALAKKMFIESEEWRAKEGADSLPRDFVYEKKEEISELYPQYYHKTDKEGRPLYIEELANIDLLKMNEIIGSDGSDPETIMRQNLIVEYEKLSDPRLPACSRKFGHLVETCCTIIDAKGISILSTPKSVYTFIQAASVLSANNYPERLGKLYVINTPWGFGAAWSVIKAFLDPVTASKINIGASTSELLKQIPAENLPAYLGGKCECAGGCKLSDAGPWNDPQYRSKAWWEKEDNPVENSSDEGVLGAIVQPTVAVSDLPLDSADSSTDKIERVGEATTVTENAAV